MLAVGLLTIVILALVALTTSSLRANEKAARVGPAGQVAESLLNKAIYDAQNDSPPGARAAFWAANGPLHPAQQTSVGGVLYDYTVYAESIPAGTGPGNRLKKVDVQLSWFNTAGTGGVRAGYGKMELHATRLVNELAP